jgi:UDP:flavonoid glycosyltransferase YjiC (YdhE family)
VGRWELNLKPYTSQDDVFRGHKIMVNTAFGFDYPHPLPPLVEMTGPLLPSPVASGEDVALPEIISNWLDGKGVNARKDLGVVYVSLGNMPQLRRCFAELIAWGLKPQMWEADVTFRVLWLAPQSQRATMPEDLPANFRVKSLGQLSHLKILAQDSVKVVISHCGMGAAQEALYFGKPVRRIWTWDERISDKVRRVYSSPGLANADMMYTSLCVA